MLNIQLLSIFALWLGICSSLAPDGPRKQGAHSRSAEFVVQIRSMQMDLRSHRGTASTCVLVLPDSKIHMEKRIQSLPGSAAQLTIFESKLTPDQMQQLRNILDSDQIKDLPHFQFKKEYAGDAGFDGYEATIAREKRLQVVGYANPLGRTNSAAELLKNEWVNSEQALRPLMHWVDATTGRLPHTAGRSSRCELTHESL